MNAQPFSHLDDLALARNLPAAAIDVSTHTATLLAYLAEFDARRLFGPAGYASMRDYCMEALHFTDERAAKRIRLARLARKFPILYAAIAEDRLTLSNVLVLAPHLTAENAEALVTAATHKTRFEIEQFLVERSPRMDVPTSIMPVSTVSAEDASVAPRAPESISELSCKHAPGRAELTSRTKFEPLAPERFALQVTIGQTAYDKLRRAQELLSHQLPSGDVAQVLERALDALVRQLERRKFAATDRPRRNRERASKDPRHIPAHVKRAVRERDGDQCTFASDAGHRCTARKFLEYDHIIEVARGGLPTVENLRLRCRVHNQYEAARTFGAGFMERKQREAADARERERPRALRELGARDPREKSDVARPPGVREPETAEAHVRPAEIDPETARDITNGLGNLGYRAPEIRRAIAHCRPLGSPNLDAHMRAALAFLRPRCVTLRPSVT